ncbi:Heat shock factor protein 4 [Psilocybe cubensis]|uniref:Heat shock factor protein 4 n=2 Tax=Psilocybe cubensis TaxID=181762 RepID=A0ACB8GUY5_PSICU|nr:Heat shock factor protein 4 [Psilocybe cubensis]KAH9479279.1 Heat shock factor protein 4 [Psilocybe cubensis]
MISDPKSAQFIAWTELGTSFVVSNVGEFSRSILGSHFKHNNFSSFVRQLNMYGFHKINRTPRAQRTSTDAQTWEFSHSKFLRGRQDLLDEIKRKALEPDPGMKHRVELPGEVAAQLNSMREDNIRMWDQLAAERRKVEKLVNVVGRLWEVVKNNYPGGQVLLPQFPSELLDSDSPNIYITSPTSTSRYPPPLSMNMHTMHTLNSPNSSPTAADFPSHMHHGHALSRQHSFQHVNGFRGDSTSSTPLPSSPGSISMELFDDGSSDNIPSGRGSTKRQRLDENGTANGINNSSDSISLMSSVSSPGSGTGPGISSLTVPKKSSRARSDSAPLGYGAALWQQGGLSSGGGGPGQQGGVGRPRSGSGLVPRGIPNIGTMTRNNNASTPLLSITTADGDLNGR